MPDFMTEIPLICVLLSCPGAQRVKGIQFYSYNTQVWLCFFVLSVLSPCAVPAADTAHFQICLKMLKHTIEKSDAMLYAPSINEITENCEHMLLKCFMLELTMVLNEEKVEDNKADCIFDFNDGLRSDTVGCQPCEAHSLQNITIFLERLNDLLQKMTAQGHM